MGKSDEYHFDYLDDNSRFADQINGALFKGRQVVKPEELEPADMQFVYLGKELGARENFKTITDKVRMWRGRLIHILAVENQTYVDYHMVFRNMLTESISYQRQWKRKKAAHEKEKDFKIGTDEFYSGMRKDEKFIPIITLVVYCGTKHPWDGARCLYDLLEIDDELKDFVTNYRLNLYDCHEHDTFEEYHTGLRQLFEVVRYGQDKDQLKKIMEENKQSYSQMDSETRELLEVVAKVKIREENDTMEIIEAKYDLCKAFVDMALEGEHKYIINAVCKKLQKGKTPEVIAEELEEDLSEIEKMIAAQQQTGNYDVAQIYEVFSAGV